MDAPSIALLVASLALGERDPSPVRVFGRVRAGETPLALAMHALGPGGSVETWSSSDGRFELRLPGADLYVWTLDVGTTRFRRAVVVPCLRDVELDFALSTASILGRVIGQDGRPLEGMQVELGLDVDSQGRASIETTGHAETDALGRFAFEHLERAFYRLRVSHGASLASSERPRFGRTVRAGLDLRGGGRIELTLSPPGACTIAGAVRNEDGTPAGGMEIFARDESGQLVDFAALARSDAGGSFRIVDLPVGRSTFFARGFGCAARESAPVALDAPSGASVELLAVRATRLYADVRDERGEPVSRVQVRVLDRGGRDCAVLERPSWPNAELEGRVVATLPPGDYRVRALHEDGTRAEGMVTLAGEPCAAIRLTLAR